MKPKLFSIILVFLGVLILAMSFFGVKKDNQLFEEILKTGVKVNNAEQLKQLADGQVVCLQGPVEVMAPAADEELGVKAAACLLQRTVNFYQYVKKTKTSDYTEEWVETPNTSDMEHARDNEPMVKLKSQTFFSPDARINGVKMPTGVLSQIKDLGLFGVKLDQEGYDRLLKMAQEGYDRRNGLIGNLVDKDVESVTGKDDKNYLLKTTEAGFHFSSSRSMTTAGDVDVKYHISNPRLMLTVIGRINGDSLTSLYLDGVKYYLVKEGSASMESMVKEEKSGSATGRTGMRVFAALLIVLAALLWLKRRKLA